MRKKVLIIGGSRFLGLNIAKEFIQSGKYSVYIMNRGTRAPVDGISKHIICDIKDREKFAKELKKEQWDIVIDTILTDEDIEFAITQLGNNLDHFIHTSSLGVYGEAKRIPAVESQSLSEYNGEEVVFNHKLKQDQVLMQAYEKHTFPATVLRMSYIYGAGDILLDAWGGRSGKFFRMLRDNEKIVIPNDGRALLHPGHVKDLGRAFLHAAEHTDSVGKIYNICGSHALMLRDYIALIADLMEVKPDIEYAPLAEVIELYPETVNKRGIKFICQHMCADITKAEHELDWHPEISLQAGICENITWMKQQNII